MCIGPCSYIVVDIETTGIDPTKQWITEIGAVKINKGERVGHYQQLINPDVSIPEKITELTGIDNEMVALAPTFEQCIPEFLAFVGTLPLVGHNIYFDFSFLKYHCQRYGYGFERSGVDTWILAKHYLPELKSRSLGALLEHYAIPREKAHRAYDDAFATYQLFEILKAKFGENTDRFQPKPMHWKAKKTAQITPKQKAYLSSLIQKHGLYEELDLEQLTKSEASHYIDRIRFLKGC